jgi:adenylate kinase family enzyme
MSIPDMLFNHINKEIETTIKDQLSKENEAVMVLKKLINQSDKENKTTIKNQLGKENEAATVLKRLINQLSKKNKTTIKDQLDKENEAAIVLKRLINWSSKENKATIKDQLGKKNKAVTVLRRLINWSSKEKNVVLVSNYKLIRQSDKIAGLNLIEDNILVPSELSSEDLTDNEEDSPRDLILGKRPVPQIYSLRSWDWRGAQKDLTQIKNPSN